MHCLMFKVSFCFLLCVCVYIVLNLLKLQLSSFIYFFVVSVLIVYIVFTLLYCNFNKIQFALKNCLI